MNGVVRLGIGCVWVIVSLVLRTDAAEDRRNLLSNSSFEVRRSEREAVGWAVTKADGSVVLDDGVSYHGELGLRLSDAKPVPGGAGDNGYIIIRQTVAGKAGETYTLSVMMKTENLSNPGGVGIGIINNGWTWEQWAHPAGATGDWTRRQVTVTLPSSSLYQVIIMLMPDVTGKVWLDAAQLELGKQPTDYEPTGIPKPTNWFKVPDPLFEELLTNQPGLCREIPYWGYNANDQDGFRSYALKHGHRWVLKEQYEEMAKYHLVAMQRPEECERYGVKYMLTPSVGEDSLRAIGKGDAKRAWLLDPGVTKAFAESGRSLVEKYGGRGLWGVFAGDEVFEQAIRAVPKEARYEYVNAADEEIRRNYGFGRYGMPDSDNDTNPFRWIAYRRWVADRLTERYRQLHDAVKAVNPKMQLVSVDPVGSVSADDYSAWGNSFDIVVGQAINEITGNRLVSKVQVGYATKCLVDLGGRPVFATVQCCDYAGSPTPEHVRERFSQVIRNGGSGIFLLAVEWFDRELNHHKYSSPARWRALLEICDRMVKMNRVRIPTDPDTAILFSSDSLSINGEAPLPMEMLSAYCLLGPLCRTWFEFVDDRQIDRGTKSLNRYKLIVVPFAKYERGSVRNKLEAWVKAGGTLVCGDPEAFTFDIDGTMPLAARERLLGARLVSKRSEGTPVKLTKSSALGTAGPETLAAEAVGFDIAISGAAGAAATYQDGPPAIVINPLGKGRVITFAFNPFTASAPEDERWVGFFKNLLRGANVKQGRDIWRFKFPPLKTVDVPEPPGECLTGNHLVFEENVPVTQRNAGLRGSYTFGVWPDGTGDEGTAGGEIPFQKGHLTNRKTAALGRVLGRWVGPCDLSPWVVTWKTPQPVDLTFDFTQPCNLNRAILWHSGQLPATTAQGSLDGKSWETLATSEKQPANPDAPDYYCSLKGRWRYLRFAFGERDAGNLLTLAEVEVWGER
ncbi:MAG: beta-galactosidase trimerization domain-containing protein [Armatimonadetes bacterium]|nr:beta-galactosidase trimerization domain-containing protein [Armatimonadota bacterium]